MKRIVVALSNGYQLRLLFHAGVVQYLKNAGYEIYVVGRDPFSQSVVAELGSDVAVIEQCVDSRNVISKYYQGIRRFFFWSGELTPNQKEVRRKFARSYPMKFGVANILSKLLNFEAKKKVHRTLLRNRVAQGVLKNLHPDAVLACSPGFMYTDAALLNEATYLGIRTVAVGQSWDNFSTKGYTYPRPELMLCWGEQMRRDAIELQGYPPATVKICGVPHFDIYDRLSHSYSRDELLREFNLDPARKTIVYGTSPGKYSEHEFDVVRRLADWVNSEPPDAVLGTPCQLLVRLSPQEIIGALVTKNLSRYDELEGPHVRVSRPLVRESSLNMDLCAKDHLLLAKTLACADVVGNLASTFSLDGVAAGKPVFSMLYDRDSQTAKEGSTKRYADYPHLKQMYATGGVSIAYSFDDMLLIIREYLQYPDRDLAARQRLISEFLYRIDGKSAMRVAREVLTFLE